MKIGQIAAQLYTLREHIKTPAEIAAALKKVRRIGYRAVQVSGMGPIEESELNRILLGEGLICCATHEPGAKILDETAAVIERLRKLNCRYTAYPYPGGVDFGSLPTVLGLAAKLDKAGQLMREAGLALTYHNHAIEFQRLEGKLALDWLYEKTDARNLQGEIDTYWVQHGGGDPVAWCRKLNRRLPLLHLKDYTVIGGRPSFAPVGCGNLDMPAIVSAADAAGCEWFIVEQDDCYGADPFEALAQSYRYLETLARK
jgi:sugar phosphate isomerase/epimerase